MNMEKVKFKGRMVVRGGNQLYINVPKLLIDSYDLSRGDEVEVFINLKSNLKEGEEIAEEGSTQPN